MEKQVVSQFHANKLVRYLVGGSATPLKNMKVHWDDEIPNIWENKIHGNQTTNQLLSFEELLWLNGL